MVKYRIKCWIPVEPGEEQFYDTLEEARRDLEHCHFLQPENIYKIEPVNDEDDGAEERGLEGLAEE